MRRRYGFALFGYASNEGVCSLPSRASVSVCPESASLIMFGSDVLAAAGGVVRRRLL